MAGAPHRSRPGRSLFGPRARPQPWLRHRCHRRAGARHRRQRFRLQHLQRARIEAVPSRGPIRQPERARGPNIRGTDRSALAPGFSRSQPRAAVVHQRGGHADGPLQPRPWHAQRTRVWRGGDRQLLLGTGRRRRARPHPAAERRRVVRQASRRGHLRWALEAHVRFRSRHRRQDHPGQREPIHDRRRRRTGFSGLDRQHQDRSLSSGDDDAPAERRRPAVEPSGVDDLGVGTSAIRRVPDDR